MKENPIKDGNDINDLINSATAEESAAASEELSKKAELLKERIDHFKLRDVF